MRKVKRIAQNESIVLDWKLIMEALKIGAAAMGISLSDTQLTQFEGYFSTLTDWNQRVNLTRIIEKDDVIAKHFLDSLSIMRAVTHLPPRVIDVGTGAGFPGVVLKIIQPDIHLTLVDSVGKKTAFLQQLVDTLGMKNVTILHARAEEVGRDWMHRGKYGLAVARALAPMPVLAEYLLPLVKIGGLMVAQKGTNPADEIASAKNAFGVLGGDFIQSLAVNIPNLDAARHLVLVRKIKHSPKQYPRKAGTPAKKPI